MIDPSPQPQPSADPDAGVDHAVGRHRSALSAILAKGNMTLQELWLSSMALGSDIDIVELEAYLQGLIAFSPAQRDVLAQAANERLDDLSGRLRVPYSRSIRGPLPPRGPLAALVHLLKAAPTALAGGLADVAAEAGLALDVDVTVYLADYDQRMLVPVPRNGRSTEPLSIEGSLPGRAYRTSRTELSNVAGQPRLWVPLLDGVERLGVLDARLSQATDLMDLHLQEECAWIASLIAHLVSAAAERGDRLDAVRRTAERTAGAELIWSLLPPLSAGTEQFSIGAVLQPAYQLGGDAFDYALSGDQVLLAVFDAMGHALGAGLIVATALSAYRAARRAGASQYDQAVAIDDAIAGQFPDAFSTGVLAQLDLRSGQLRYLRAGQPAPLLLRDGKVVGALDAGARPPFGLGTGEVTLAEAALQPGDWLVLYSDGITEARAPDGTFFGLQRLIDFLEREAAGELPPAETVRRLMHAVLRHQNGALQDDATILLAQWRPAPDTPPPPANG